VSLYVVGLVLTLLTPMLVSLQTYCYMYVLILLYVSAY
jgi:hypothetical protein